jgi:hypothetical protein
MVARLLSRTVSSRQRLLGIPRTIVGGDFLRYG